ncbi:MAG: type 4a pilus biogenesis protein PilO [Desulfuromonadales bacterium]|nr:type 4a pilus biogenesis protein PilO [Desulfuromonadales bacterium]
MHPQVEKFFKLPLKEKVAAVVLIIILLCAAFYFGLERSKIEEINSLNDKVETLKGDVAKAKKLADNLPALRLEYQALNMELDKALVELPKTSEIPALLTSISGEARGSGLDVLTFKPGTEKPKDFYAELPITIRLGGTFQNTGDFFTKVANLPRIVNITDISVADVKADNKKAVKLTTTCTATTFRFLDKPVDNKNGNKNNTAVKK